MSVVNKMLQDLEERKAEPELSADYRPSTEPKKSFLSIYLILMVSVIILLVWLFKDNLFSSSTSAIDVVNTPENQEQNTLQQLEETPNSEPKVVSELLQINESTVTEVELVEQSEPLNPVNQQADDNPSVDTQNLKNVEQQSDYQLSQNNLQQSVDNQNIEVDEQLAAQDKEVEVRKVEQKLTKLKTSSTQPEVQKLGESDTVDGVFEMKSSQAAVDKATLKQQIQVALKRGDDRTAVKLLQKLVKVAPDNTAARKRLASMLFAQGEHEKANMSLQTGIDLYPGNLELRIMQARLYEQMKKPVEGFEILMSHAVSAYQAPDYVAYRATLAQKVNRFEQARTDYQQLTKSQSANAKWWLGLAVVEERLGNMSGALDAYQNVKQLSQMSVEVEEFVEQRIRYLAGVN
ncbi:tetratricopeptide repeat protein [Aliiglaciecola sp. 3_MG-2023]|uniref:tetratricopeptide repeat protein n=1 Tax=Aliiglaciecola sp. 3_MG-2023 TaxID=3062644 RepID=UPI0026E17656|nr:tetratricopeptide repeat protein [Aliiglaciecola sp. 3_MG-2023]MDO6695527.1 tetratricopeptide repeat protein [Aliiglaciecola sp. 3_MG-2023]